MSFTFQLRSVVSFPTVPETRESGEQATANVTFPPFNVPYELKVRSPALASAVIEQ